MNTWKLRNGSEEAEAAVKTVMMVFNQLAESDDLVSQLALYDIGRMAKEAAYKAQSHQLKLLQQLSLVDSSGRIHTTVKNIAASAVVVESFGASLQDPRAPSSPTPSL